MAGLFVVHEADRDFAGAALSATRSQFARHGFAAPAEHAFGGWRLLHAPHILGGPESLLVRGDDMVAVAGTFVCDGKLGRPALEALLAMDGLPRIDWSRIGGQFVALVRRSGRTFLFTDYFAAFQAFRDESGRFFSTSFLAAAGALPKLHFDPQAVYEMAFNVVPIGDDTVFSELKLLGPERVVELAEDGPVFHAADKPLPTTPIPGGAVERIASHRARLTAIVAPHVAAFGERIFCPLSGGLDSRLLLAALRAEGARPEIYVYGRRAARMSRSPGRSAQPRASTSNG